MLTKENKAQQIDFLSEKLKSSKAVILTSFRGLKIDELTQLRKSLKKEGIYIQVVKNTLLKRVFESNGKKLTEEVLSKPLAVIFSAEDEIAPAKLVSTFNKEHEKLEIVGGIYEDNIVSEDVIRQLALLPSKEELLAKVVGSLAAPISRLAGALRWNGYAVTSILSQYLKMKQTQN